MFPDYQCFLLAILPPGAFLGLGLLIAGKNWIDQRASKKAQLRPAPAMQPGGATA